MLVCQITTKIRNDAVSLFLSNDNLTIPMSELCEVRCNKIATVRIWDKTILHKISEVTPNALNSILNIVKTVF